MQGLNMLGRLRMAVSRIAYADAQQMLRLPPLERSLIPMLAVGSTLYKLLLLLRHKLYQWDVFTSVRLPVPVISIGNVTWGGSGKTPMVEYLARRFLQVGISPLILTRGYGGGDEVRLLQSHLCQTPALIGVGRDRVEVAAKLFRSQGVMSLHNIDRLASKLYHSNELTALLNFTMTDLKDELLSQTASIKDTGCIGVILLDDGMQHWRIIRDIEIVMVNAVSLFGNETLLPYGPLREPLDALSRADIIVIHHAYLVPYQRVQAIKHRLKPLLNPETVILCSRMVPHFLIKVPSVPLDLKNIFTDCLGKRSDLLVPLDVIRNATVLCISAIGCPESLSLALEQLGAAYTERMDFPDHHHFQAKDLLMVQKKLCDLSEKLKQPPIVVLTEKDYARDPATFGGLKDADVFVLHATMEVINESGDVRTFNAMLAKKIQGWKYESNRKGKSFNYRCK